MEKKRLFYLDFIRAISTFAILIYHFNVAIVTQQVVSPIIFKNNFVNVDLGHIGVSLFIIISGAALMVTYGKELSLKKYAKKRFLSLYPCFWIAYLFVCMFYFYKNKAMNHSFFGKIILTVIGMDGYTAYKIPNFYIIGEWFLGCIILLYLIFPIIRNLMLKNFKIYMLSVFILNLIFIRFYRGDMPVDRVFLSRIFEFSFGMCFVMLYNDEILKKYKSIILILAIISSVIILFIPINVYPTNKITIAGISIFIILAFVSNKFDILNGFIELISKYSYCIFLLHHVIINEVVSRFNNCTLNIVEVYSLLIICLGIIMFLSKILLKITNDVMKSVLLKKIFDKKSI